MFSRLRGKVRLNPVNPFTLYTVWQSSFRLGTSRDRRTLGEAFDVRLGS